MTWLFIEPSDVWFFRDARPFSTGGGHTARGMFPPSPWTLQGALRSLVLGRSTVDWPDFLTGAGDAATALAAQIGGPTALGAFAMHGPFLARQTTGGTVECLAPMPADTYVEQHNAEGREVYAAFRPTKKLPLIADTRWPVDLKPLWTPDGTRKDAPGAATWITVADLEHYLQGLAFSGLATPFEREPRLGIAPDYERRTVAQGMLYQTEFVRPHAATGLLVWVDPAVELPDSGWLALGGQARAAYYRSVDETELRLPPVPPATQRIKILLLTPAYFSGGWQPGDGDWSRVLGCSANLISVALPRALDLGGRDIAHNHHRPMYTYVAPGSVYFFELAQPLQSQPSPFTQTPPDALPHDRLGFGQYAIGTWDWLP